MQLGPWSLHQSDLTDQSQLGLQPPAKLTVAGTVVVESFSAEKIDPPVSIVNPTVKTAKVARHLNTIIYNSPILSLWSCDQFNLKLSFIVAERYNLVVSDLHLKTRFMRLCLLTTQYLLKRFRYALLIRNQLR